MCIDLFCNFDIIINKARRKQPSLLTHIFISNEFAFGYEWSIQNYLALDAKYFYLLLSFDWFEVPPARK